MAKFNVTTRNGDKVEVLTNDPEKIHKVLSSPGDDGSNILAVSEVKDD